MQQRAKFGAGRLEKILEFRHGVHIPHDAIHKALSENGLASENRRKKKRRKPWIRYERRHSLTAIHLDWHTSKAVQEKQVCIAIDDSSRRIHAGGEYDSATAEISMGLVQEVLDRFGDIRQLEQVITDRGSQFYANKKDKNGYSASSFESFLKSSGNKQIKAPLKHPQTDGKVKKWYDLYEKHRLKFDNFDNFVNWYNSFRYHESLDTKHYLQTPDDAFWARLPQACMLKMSLNIAEEEFNVKD